MTVQDKERDDVVLFLSQLADALQIEATNEANRPHGKYDHIRYEHHKAGEQILRLAVESIMKGKHRAG